MTNKDPYAGGVPEKRVIEIKTLAPEAHSFSEPIRELLYGKGTRGTYRIIYAIIDDCVFILHVRHG